ncbi:unnamed protein product [Amoebophrya sp. A120]|nr:unnamed protein product [Amoebophrya sp. A120]|eukprot:GSA120T00012066001.1
MKIAEENNIPSFDFIPGSAATGQHKITSMQQNGRSSCPFTSDEVVITWSKKDCCSTSHGSTSRDASCSHDCPGRATTSLGGRLLRGGSWNRNADEALFASIIGNPRKYRGVLFCALLFAMLFLFTIFCLVGSGLCGLAPSNWKIISWQNKFNSLGVSPSLGATSPPQSGMPSRADGEKIIGLSRSENESNRRWTATAAHEVAEENVSTGEGEQNFAVVPGAPTAVETSAEVVADLVRGDHGASVQEQRRLRAQQFLELHYGSQAAASAMLEEERVNGDVGIATAAVVGLGSAAAAAGTRRRKHLTAESEFEQERQAREAKTASGKKAADLKAQIVRFEAHQRDGKEFRQVNQLGDTSDLNDRAANSGGGAPPSRRSSRPSGAANMWTHNAAHDEAHR